MLPNTPKSFRKKLLRELEELWDSNPEYHFSDLMVSLFGDADCKSASNIKNDVLMEKIKKFKGRTK